MRRRHQQQRLHKNRNIFIQLSFHPYKYLLCHVHYNTAHANEIKIISINEIILHTYGGMHRLQQPTSNATTKPIDIVDA